MLVTDHGCAGLRPGANTGHSSKLDNWLLEGEVEKSDNKWKELTFLTLIGVLGGS